MKLTDRGVLALRTDLPQEDFWDTNVPGLVLRLGATGRKTWAVRYVRHGVKRRLKLGTYPHLSLADAREAARAAIREADAGEDPAQVRRELREGGATFAEMAEEVLLALEPRTRPKTREERRRILDKELLPAWGKRPATEVSRRDVVRLVEGIAGRGAPVAANRTLALVKVLYNEALGRGFPGIEASPAHLLRPPAQEAPRDRYLTRDEIAALWAATVPEHPGPKAIVRLALLTGQRVGSVCAMRWEEIETNGAGVLWRIPPESFKGRRPHLVPLSDEAVEIIEGIRPLRMRGESYVFPSREKAKEPHVTNLGKMLARVRRNTRLADGRRVPHYTLHDFRTTFRTWSVRASDDGGLGVPGPIADAVLGHKEGSLGFSRYTGDKDRYLLAEKRDALARWGAWVRAAVEGGA